MSGIPSMGTNSQPNAAKIGVQPIRLPRAADLRLPSPAAPAAAGSGAGGTRSTDSVSLRPGLAGAASGIAVLEKSLHEAQSRVDDLDRVSGLLSELRAIVADARRGNDSTAIADTQARIDAIISTISQAEATASFRTPVPASLGLGYQIQEILPGYTRNATGYAEFAPGQDQIDVHVQIVASAQQGGFYLSLGAGALNLAGGTGFTIEVAGAKGVQTFTFVSGTTTDSIAQAINQFSAQTGVWATQYDGNGYLPTGLQFRSQEYSDSAFVSVKVLDSGGIHYAPGHAQNTGIYKLIDDASNLADTSPGSLTEFWQAYNGVTDYGQDVEAIVNGVQAQTTGTRIRAAGQNWRISFDIDVYASHTMHQPFTPFRFVRTTDGRDGIGPIDPAAIEQFGSEISAQRAAATERLGALKDQLRADLGTPQPSDERQAHLDTLAALRKSLLGQ